ncbi:hypothetical protein [Spiroplasma sp. DGKH1]|uniref:hypothetical protein n=1 Tax=Spiroplasma sp. DGKH1 TaxID=3050074 RepID=UPI0034C672CF
MIDTKDLKILTRIMTKEKWNNIKELIENLKFSRGDFNYHWEHINKFYKKNNLDQLDVNNLNSLSYPAIKKSIQLIFENINDLMLNSQERILLILLLIIIKRTIKLAEIKKFFSISLNSAFNDIQNLITWLAVRFDPNQISIINNGKGYRLLGNELTKRKVLVNVIIEIVNHDNYEVIKTLLFAKLTEDFHNIKADNNLTNQTLFEKIEITLKDFQKELQFIDVEIRTLTFILFTIIMRWRWYEDGTLFLSVFEKKIFYEKQIAFKIAEEILDQLFNKLNFAFPCPEFEKFYFSILLSSSQQMVVCDNIHNDYLLITSFLKHVISNLRTKGYEINEELAINTLWKYLNWLKHTWDKTLIHDYSSKLKLKIIKNNLHYQQLYNDLLTEFTNSNAINFFNIVMARISDIVLQFLVFIIKFPDQNDSNFQNTILVTNTKGGLINILKLQIKELFPNLHITKTMNVNFYLKHHELFKDYIKISDYNKIEDEHNGIYINFHALNILENNKLTPPMLKKIKTQIKVIINNKTSSEAKIAKLITLIETLI